MERSGADSGTHVRRPSSHPSRRGKNYLDGRRLLALTVPSGWLSMYRISGFSRRDVTFGLAVSWPCSSYRKTTDTVLPAQLVLNFDSLSAFSAGGVSRLGPWPQADTTCVS